MCICAYTICFCVVMYTYSGMKFAIKEHAKKALSKMKNLVNLCSFDCSFV